MGRNEETGPMTDANPVLGLSEAIRRTTQTITARAARYRNVVIAVVVVAVASMLGALVWWSWVPLLGLLGLVPLAGAFMYFDGRLVQRWQRQILEAWQQETLALGTFVQAMEAMTMLPEDTLRSMLATLPAGSEAPSGPPPVLREALVATIAMLNGCQNNRLGSVLVAQGVALAAVVVAVAQGAWAPLLGVALVVPVLGMGKGLRGRRIRRWLHQVRRLKQHGLDVPRFAEQAARLNWEAVSEHQKNQALGMLHEAEPAGMERMAL